MWKFVTRGIRETLERRVCRTNIYSQPSQDNAKNEVKTSLTCQQKFLAPIFLTYDKGFCGSAKSAGAKGKEDDYKWNTRHTWTEAFGWSSVLAAGWIVCQSLSLHKRVFEGDNKERKNKLFNYTGVSRVLTLILNLEARHILPVTNCVGNGSKNLKLQNENSEPEWNAEKQFGPITVEEALKEAIDEFANTHKIVVGEYELRYGIKALEEKRYKDAWAHFSQGAKLSSPGSMFNLGLCYELGVGTLADQKKAMKYYNDAAAHDHADALYNLGVFHAQGKGGLPIDIDVARTYFTRAANLGQVQAQHALDLEKTATQPKENSNTTIMPKSCLQNAALDTCKINNTHSKLGNYDGQLSANFAAESTRVEPEYNERILSNPTQVFLDFLGLRESNKVPIIITTNDCSSVPC